MAMSAKIGVNHHGNLRFRIYWRSRSFQERAESADGTSWKDTPENRREAQETLDKINADIKADRFDYLKYFPKGNKAEHFKKEKAAAAPKTIRSFYAEWITKFENGLAKKSRERGYRLDFQTYILPTHGDQLLSEFGVSDIRALMVTLAAKKHRFDTDGTRTISIKTIKNALNGSLRALFRDAVAEELIQSNPFDRLPKRWWPKHSTPPPDPFEETERDEIIIYFQNKWGGEWRAAYVFVYALFWAGARPSELTARKWRDLDLRTGKLSITNSRTDGEEGDTKTYGSTRTITLFPQVLKLIESVKPLRAQPDGYIFMDRRGTNPIDHWYFGEYYFQAALTALKLRHRDFYHTRSTFISAMLSHQENIQKTAEYTGTSVAMIVKHYGKYIGDQGAFGQAAMQAGREQKERVAR